MPTTLTPDVLLDQLDRQGAVRRWLSELQAVGVIAGDRLVDYLIGMGFGGDPCERAELVLEVLEDAGMIERGKLDPVMGRSGLAWSAAFGGVDVFEKRRCWCWVPAVPHAQI